MLGDFVELLETGGKIFKVSALFVPFLLPTGLAILFFHTWLRYIRTKYIANQDYVLLEIKVPKDITKTPLAMEIFLTALYQSGSVTYFDTYRDGKIKPWFSLELVSIEGQVKFFIWSQAKWRKLIEAQIYGQYPSVEIYEAEDYTQHVKHNPAEVTMWGTYYKLAEKDVYPIKTYIDYGLEKAGDEEEEKVDPMTAVIEYLGSIKKGEQVWIQILIQAHKKMGLREGRLRKKADWKKEAKDEIEKIRKEATPGGGDTSEGFPKFVQLTKGQELKITAIERSMDKMPFECMIRAFYIAKKEAFQSIAVPGLIGSVRQYNSNNLNGFRLGWYTDHSDNKKDWITIFSWVPGYLKRMQKMRDGMERQMLEAYKMRSFFQPPYRNFNAQPFILTTEELATIYHFPGQVSTTPTFERIGSRKSRPPSNLPI